MDHLCLRVDNVFGVNIGHFLLAPGSRAALDQDIRWSPLALAPSVPELSGAERMWTIFTVAAGLLGLCAGADGDILDSDMLLWSVIH